MSYAGECVSCGQCCTANVWIPTVGFMQARCENLLVAEGIGQPQSTVCVVHEKIYDGMAIKMKFPNGTTFESRCLGSYPRKQDAIPLECSYQWNSPTKQPKWTTGYMPKLGDLVTQIF